MITAGFARDVDTRSTPVCPVRTTTGLSVDISPSDELSMVIGLVAVPEGSLAGARGAMSIGVAINCLLPWIQHCL